MQLYFLVTLLACVSAVISNELVRSSRAVGKEISKSGSKKNTVLIRGGKVVGTSYSKGLKFGGKVMVKNLDVAGKTVILKKNALKDLSKAYPNALLAKLLTPEAELPRSAASVERAVVENFGVSSRKRRRPDSLFQDSPLFEDQSHKGLYQDPLSAPGAEIGPKDLLPDWSQFDAPLSVPQSQNPEMSNLKKAAVAGALVGGVGAGAIGTKLIMDREEEN